MTNKKKANIIVIAAITTGMAFAGGDEEAKVTQTADAAVVQAAAADPAAAPESNEFKWGGDFRLRGVYFDNIPYAVGPAEARGGVNIFQRYRTRVFGEYHPNENLFFRGRLVNEWRSVQEPDTRNAWAAFDETIFDNLFVDYKHDMFDVRVGRQDMIYGTGKVILDGTPLDGSRTIYFDAAKATYKGIDNTTVDFIAMYTHSHDPLAIHTQDRSLTGLTPAYEGVEAGGGVYIKNKGTEDLPWEAYWILKTDEQFLPDGDEINTVGARLIPKWSEACDGNLEMAYQSSPGVSAFMIDALANWHIEAMEEQKATLGLGWYHLSEDWDPIFARWPQYSELYVYSFDTTGAGQWQNVSMPHIDFSISPMKNLTTDLLLGYMFAPQDNGPGSGYNRGLLFTWWNKFTIREKMLSDRDKLTGHVLLEVMQPADYYSAAQRDHTASFVRLELNYAF